MRSNNISKKFEHPAIAVQRYQCLLCLYQQIDGGLFELGSCLFSGVEFQINKRSYPQCVRIHAFSFLLSTPTKSLHHHDTLRPPHMPSLVVGRPDDDITSTDLLAIERFGILSILLGHHGHKGKTTAAPIVTGDDVHVPNVALLGKGLPQLLRGGVKVQIAHVQLGIAGVRRLSVGRDVGRDPIQMMLRGGDELVLIVESEQTVTGLVPGMGADGTLDAAGKRRFGKGEREGDNAFVRLIFTNYVISYHHIFQISISHFVGNFLDSIAVYP